MNAVHPAISKKIIIRHSIQQDIKSLLIFAQICGQLPINGIGNKSSDALSFTFKSPKFVYFLFVCCGLTFLAALQLYEVLKSGADLHLISDLMFYGCMLTLSVCFLQVAMKWKRLMTEWQEVENNFSGYEQISGLNFRVKVINASFGCLAAVQYLMKIITDISVTINCKSNGEDILEYYFRNVSFKQVFAIIGYSTIIGLLLQLFNLLASLFWLLTDAFIVIMSTALAMRYKQINDKMKSTFQSQFHISSWVEIRAHYNKLCRLCKLLDEALSPIILISFAQNLFTILIQLFNSLRNVHNNMEKAYFFFSFGSVILRVIAVTLYGAWINDESKRPIVILSSVSSVVYNAEIAGAIVTYELVLIQFNENLLRGEHPNNTINIC